jgi:hypothetical protein
VRKINAMITTRNVQEREEQLLAEASRRLRLEETKGDRQKKYHDDSSMSEDDTPAPVGNTLRRPPVAPKGSSRPPAVPKHNTNSHVPSPALIHCMQFLEYAYSIGEGSTHSFALSKPSTAIALPNGDLCVADTGSHRLLLVSVGATHGSVQGAVSDDASGGALKQPRGLACDATALYVSEAGGSRVRKMRLPEDLRKGGAATPRGAHIGGLRVLDDDGGCTEARLSFPQGVTLSGGELFVCDCEDHRIVVYDALTLEYRRSFGGYGDDEGELSFPYSCTILADECVVADTANHRLSVFNKDTGLFLRCLGREGVGRAEFTNPRGVTYLRSPDASGPNGRGRSVLVTCEKTRVQVLTLAGECLELLDVPHATDLWSVCNVGEHIVLVDKTANALHVLNPVFRHTVGSHSASPASCASPAHGSGYASPLSLSRHVSGVSPGVSPGASRARSTPLAGASHVPDPASEVPAVVSAAKTTYASGFGSWLGRTFCGAGVTGGTQPSTSSGAAPSGSGGVCGGMGTRRAQTTPTAAVHSPPPSRTSHACEERVGAAPLPAPSQNAVQQVVQSALRSGAATVGAGVPDVSAEARCSCGPAPSTPQRLHDTSNASAETSPSPRRQPALLDDLSASQPNSPNVAVGHASSHQSPPHQFI